jgi:flagella basal body P-ring formation protein FlgA
VDISRVGTALSQRAASVSKADKKVAVVEAGQNAQVVVARPSLQITAQVVCLERGLKGQWIRVRMREGRARVFRAEVVSAGLLSVEQGALR